VEIKKDSAILLRERGKLISQGEDFDTYEINFEYERIFLREIIWHGSNVRIIEPANLVEQLLDLVEGVLS
jgi:predicted DNA-binding transcriptional regulator YafY